MTKLYIMCGVAFSGKSTLAKRIAKDNNCMLIAFDELWVEEDKIKPIPKNAEGWRFIRDLAQKKIKTALQAGKSVVYDDNNPRKEHREELRSIAKEVGADTVVIYLDTPLKVIREREEANRKSLNRHTVEPENFNKVMKDMEILTVEENVMVFTPRMDINEFILNL